VTEISDALRGPWVAILTDNYGWPRTVDDFEEGGNDIPEIAVVRGSAAPNGPAGIYCRPGSYQSDDLLYEIDCFDDRDELAMRWEQAQAVADALNALAGEG
jgi:hypothetical protein